MYLYFLFNFSPQDVPRDHLELSEVGFGAGVFSGSYDKLETSWPVEACKEALKSGN